MKKENEQLEKLNSTLTEEEKAAPSYLDWSDETLGRLARAVIHKLKNTDVKGWTGVTTMAACYVLMDACLSTNAGTMTIELGDYTNEKHKEIGLTKGIITVEIEHP